MKLLSPYVVLFLAYSPDIFPDLFQFSGGSSKARASFDSTSVDSSAGLYLFSGNELATWEPKPHIRSPRDAPKHWNRTVGIKLPSKHLIVSGSINDLAIDK